MKELDKEQLDVVHSLVDAVTGNLRDYHHNNNKYINTFLKQKGLIKKEFEVGKWYKDTYYGNVYFVTETRIDGGVRFYGLNGNNDWVECDSYSRSAIKNDRKATNKEVETALIKVARKRGFKEGVVVVNEKGNKDNIEEYFWYGNGILKNCGFTDNIILFDNGKWATIIEEPKVKEMTMAEVNKALGYEIKIKE